MIVIVGTPVPKRFIFIETAPAALRCSGKRALASRMTKYLEPLAWTGALLVLFFLDPAKEGPSLCLGRLLGGEGCPGCGIGHSIHYALHGAIRRSVEEHILGLPASTKRIH
ncbi:MAG TPA: DUF2752 domain-containing protein [Chitinophagaceae bacterium]